MIIEKLNSICHRHNRWLFGIFTLIIIVSFLGFLTPGNFGLEFAGGQGVAVGTAFGKKVTVSDLYAQQRKVAIFYQMFYGMVPRSDIPANNLFYFICLERQAEAMGLSVSDAEVAAALKSLPQLNENGKYDPEKYKNLIADLKKSGISEKDLIDVFRSRLLINKLQEEINSSVAVTDSEAKECFRYMNTVFAGKLYEFTPAAADKVAVDDQALEAYFNENRSKYTVVGNLSALIAGFPVQNYEAQSAKEADDKTLESFFEVNKSNYGEAKDFASVREKVQKDYVSSRAVVLAKNAAYDFARPLYESLDGKSVNESAVLFRKKALESKLDFKSGAAKLDDKAIAGIESGELIKALDAAGEPVPITEPVITPKMVCVGFTVAKTPTRNADFAEAKKSLSLVSDFRTYEAQRLAQKRAQEFVDALSKLTSSAEKDKYAAEFKDGKVSDLEFSYVGKMPAAGKELATFTLANLAIGEYSSVVNTAAAPAVVKLEKRTAPDMSKFEAEKEKYRNICLQQKLAVALNQLEESIARSCSYNPPEGFK